MTARLDQPRDTPMLVTIYMDGMPFAVCMAETVSLSEIRIRLSPWALHPEKISEVAFTRESERGVERHRVAVTLGEARGNRARLLFEPMNPGARAALRDLLEDDTPSDRGGTDDPAQLPGVG